jgi:hypothetical protein
MHLIGDRNSNKRGITVPCSGETRNRCQKSLEMASYCVIPSKKKKKEFVKLCPKTKSNFISYKKLNSICYSLPIHFALYGPERKKREKDSDVYSCNRSFTKTHKRFTDELLRWFTLIDTTGKKRKEFFNYYYRSYTVTYKELSFH